MERRSYGYRIASIALAILALVVLVGLWLAGQTDFLFVPLLLAAAGSLCLRLYKKNSQE